ncbi:MAG: 23S rRNA (uracil(1939)-C(5))-methyltransferase RlmD [Bacteroidaceae bacterium]|nr:23S rRNA (uracil(1939)-C(5))-methyltransferase RlmD [Bacteroidaceae bacterium]MBR1789719.1 23S rRNA (uracil(1939)-C(5))-methyltransferase RlmD [Bacteroidaceae bacterium]
MSRKRKELPILEQIEITDVAAEGKAMARVNDLVVFVPWVVPGDVVDLKIRKKKHHYAEAEAVKFHKRSEQRTEPFCPHFGLCGGCKWQMLPYEEQLRWKQKQVMDALTRIGKVELPECQPILGSKKTHEYRNKLDFGCSNKQWLTEQQLREGVPFEPGIGFHISGAFDKVLPITSCALMDNLNNDIRNWLYDYATAHRLTFYDLRAQEGFLRGIVMRNSLSGEWMVTVQFGPKAHVEASKEAAEEECRSESLFDREEALQLLEAMHTRFPQITSLMYVYNPKCNDTFGDLDVKCYSGTPFIYELMEGLRFKVGPKSFYQTNTEQAHELYKVAREFAGLDSSAKPIVYDLYTGTGTIANFVAREARQVIGIEYVPEAIEDAKVNSEINDITNTRFFAGDMKDILTDDFIAQHGRPDVVITDPPRAGMHADVVATILRAAPERIVYVSCNPATQARDLSLLDEAYRVARVQPVDMFPHTQHVENVVLLTRRSAE